MRLIAPSNLQENAPNPRHARTRGKKGSKVNASERLAGTSGMSTVEAGVEPIDRFEQGAKACEQSLRLRGSGKVL